MKYKRSQFLQSIKCTPEYTTFFHSFFGRGLVVRTGIAESLLSAVAPVPLSRFKNIPNKLLQEFIDRDFLVHAGLKERDYVVGQFIGHSSKRINRLSVTAANICNFECFNCIHFKARSLDNRSFLPKRMHFDTFRLAADWVAESMLKQGHTRISINFGGGEPLLNWPVIKKILQYLRKKYGSALNMELSINTNASLINHEIARLLKKRNVHIVTSLDGTKEGNDRTRKMKSGSSFDHIMKSFKLLSSLEMPVMAVHILLNSRNFDDIDKSFIDLLSSMGIISMSIDPDLTDLLPQSVSALVDKIMRLRRYAKKNNISVIGYWERPFGKIIRKDKNLETHFCHAMGGETLDLLPDGSIYGCSYTDMKLGNIEEFVNNGSMDALMNSQAYRDMVQSRRVGNIALCKGCDLEGVCGGGCYVTVAHAAKNEDDGILEYRCKFYREITRQLIIDSVEYILLSI